MSHTALLALEDGSLFYGQSIGINGEVSGEVVFNTSMTGYQEILTDPSYYQQIVTMTYPHIGNVGVNLEDNESARVFARGLIIKQLPFLTSSWRSEKTLNEFLVEENIVAIADIDTRRLTRILRDKGAQNGCIVSGQNLDADKAIKVARAFPGLKGTDLAKEVTTNKQYEWSDGTWLLKTKIKQNSIPGAQRLRVVAYDFGVKRNILRILIEKGCQITVVPASTHADEIMSLKPDGVFLSNGPGDPEPCDYAIEAIRNILNTKTPIFGICLGYQLLALAAGATTEKMKFGHHGANHPVQDLNDKRVLITSQNHGFAVNEATLPKEFTATHRSLFDGSLQGIHHQMYPAFGFQGHPEASPGPHDIQYLFDHFIELMQNKTAD
ncbi:MAG: glutamine-hydrolyzing carbamoyl-phosphate synthase small subunit [Gammaproteobacteria bacterium]